MNDLINQQRERIVLMQRLKRESDSVLGPVLDYCRDNGIGEIGRSMTQALIAEHSSQREEIEVLKAQLVEVTNGATCQAPCSKYCEAKAVGIEMRNLKSQLESAEQRVKELEEISAGLCNPEGSDEAYGRWLDYQEQLRAKGGE